MFGCMSLMPTTHTPNPPHRELLGGHEVLSVLADLSEDRAPHAAPLELHEILGQSARLVAEHVLHLPEISCHVCRPGLGRRVL